MDDYTPALPYEIGPEGEIIFHPVGVEQAAREGMKLPAPNLSTVKTFFESLTPGAGLRTVAALEPGETLVFTNILVNSENKNATTAKKVTFRIKTKAGATNMEAVVSKIAAGSTAVVISMSGPLVFAYTASAKENLQVEAEMETEMETRICLTYYTTLRTS